VSFVKDDSVIIEGLKNTCKAFLGILFDKKQLDSPPIPFTLNKHI
jgi:hypothetical protein